MANDTVLPGTGETVRDVQKGTPKTQVFILDRGGSGTEDIAALGDATNGIDVDVTRLPALVAGTANIGDVDVLTVPAPLSTTGGGTEATALRVTVANNSTGLLPVSGTVTANAGTGTFTVSGTVTANAGSGTLTVTDTASQVDDAAFTPATGRVLMVGATFDDVAPDSVNEGDGGAVRMSANRNVYTTIRDAAGNERGANVSAGNALLTDSSATTQPVSGTLAATQSGTWTVQPGNTANTTAWKVDGSAVTQPVSGTVTASNAAGDIAHDAADSGNPVKVGGKAAIVVPTAVTAADRVNAWLDLNGRQVVTMITDTATLSNVAASASSVTVLASNTGRKGAVVVNDSAVNCYLKFGSTASATSYTVKMVPDQMYEVPFGYTGILTGIWDSATGNARVTEIT